MIEPLDRIPLPARDLFKIDRETYMFSSRGCPYRCVFCASSRFWNKVRLFSAEYVVDEIKHLIENYNVKRIHFFDDFFIVNKNRVRRIHELLKKEDILGRVSFTCSSRVDFIDDDIVKLLRDMNFETMSFGFESGHPRVLKYLKADTTTVEENARAIRTVKKQGINCVGTFIIGSPDETEEEILTTLNFIKGSELDNFEVYVLVPFPGTPIWEYAKARGLVSEDMNWESLGANFAESHEKTVILSEKLTKEKLYELYLRFQKERKRRRMKYIFRESLRHPWRVPIFLSKKMGRSVISEDF